MTTRVWTGRGLRLHVDEMALACCAVEVAVALPALALDDLSGGVDGHVLVVSGTVTLGALPVVLARYAALPEPRFVVAFGACAIGGGPYWDSYSAVTGISEHLPVDVMVPGCPPRPPMVLAALDDLAAVIADGVRQ